ncbi:MAG: hypothetical protein AB1649_21005 [Chloroflexota bacterium]
MTVLTTVLLMLVAGLAVGLMAGFVILCIDRHRKSTRILNVKDGITLEYDCSAPGIYERVKAILNDK